MKTIVSKAQVIKAIGAEAWEKIIKSCFFEPVFTDNSITNEELFKQVKDEVADENGLRDWVGLKLHNKNFSPLLLANIAETLALRYSVALTAEMKTDILELRKIIEDFYHENRRETYIMQDAEEVLEKTQHYEI